MALPDLSAVRWDFLLHPTAEKPVCIDDMPPAERAMVLRCTPSTPFKWVPWLKPPSRMWRVPHLAADHPFAPALLDETFAVAQARLDSAVTEMSKCLTGVYAIPYEKTWAFTHSQWAPLMWAVFVLIADRGSHTRLTEALRNGVDPAVPPAAAAIVLRVHQLVERAMASFPAIAALDATVSSSINASTVLFPNTGNLVVLRPAAAKALAAAMLAADIWAGPALARAPPAVIGALRPFGANELFDIYSGCIGDVRQLKEEQNQFQLIPSNQEPIYQQIPVPPRMLMMLAMCRFMLSHQDRSFTSALVARALMWAERVAVNRIIDDLEDVHTPNLWRVCSAIDSMSYICTTTHERFTVPHMFAGDLYWRVRLCRQHYPANVPLETMLSCAPMPSMLGANEHVLMPPATMEETWRRMLPLGFTDLRANVVPFADGKLIEKQPDHVKICVALVCESALAVRRHAAMVYELPDTHMDGFVSMITGLRNMGIWMGDRCWVDPRNFAISDKCIAIESSVARILSLRTMMLRIYGPSRPILHFPFVSPIMLRELCTLPDIADDDLRAEMATALCDMLACMMRATRPRKFMAADGMPMMGSTLKIAGKNKADIPWPEFLCRRFLPAFLGRIYTEYFTRQTLGRSQLLYNGYHNTLFTLIRCPIDNKLGQWRWPKVVAETVLRYFFLIYVEQCGITTTSIAIPELCESNPHLVQALAFIYIQSVIAQSTLVDLVDNGRINSQHRDRKKHPVKRHYLRPSTAYMCSEFAIERGVLKKFPIQGDNANDDIVARLKMFDTPESLAFTPGEYGTLVGTRTSLIGKGQWSRTVPRAALMVVRRGVRSTDLASAMVECVHPELAGTRRVEKPNGPKPTRIRKKKGDVSAPPPAPKPRPGRTMTVDSDMMAEDVPVHQRMPKAKWPSARVAKPVWKINNKSVDDFMPGLVPEKQSKPDAGDGDSDSDSASDTDEEETEVPDTILPESSEDTETDRAKHIRRQREDAMCEMNTLLSRFVIATVTLEYAQEHHDPLRMRDFVRGVLGSLAVSDGDGNRSLNWENPLVRVGSWEEDIEKGAKAVTEEWKKRIITGLYAAPLPGVTMSSSGFAPKFYHALTSLELAPFMSRVNAVADCKRMEQVCNFSPDMAGLEALRHFEIPYVSPNERKSDGAPCLIFPHTPMLSMRHDFVGGATGKCTLAPVDASPVARAVLARDAPYDFRFANWMFGALPFTARGASSMRPGFGMETVGNVGGGLYNILKQQPT